MESASGPIRTTLSSVLGSPPASESSQFRQSTTLDRKKPPRFPGRPPSFRSAGSNIQKRVFSKPSFLEVLPGKPADMGVRRCTVCHLYVDGAPHPHLVHAGQCGESCRGDHHPSPCDYTNKDTGACSHYDLDDKSEETALSSQQLLARDQTRQEEMGKMSDEIVALKRRESEFDRMSVEMAEMREMMKSMRGLPPHGGSLASPPTSLPAVPSSLEAGAGGGLVRSLVEDVQAHTVKNRFAPPSSQPPGVYQGPTMPDLRKDADLDRVASRVLELLEKKIPQIRGNVVPPPANNAGTGVTSSLPSRPISSQYVQPGSHPAYEALRGMSASDLDLGGANHDAQRGGGGVLLSDEEVLDASAIMQLCTVSNRRQLRPHEFAKMGRFSYANKITDKNITIPLYVMGYLQHVVALLKGVVPVQSNTEVVDRLVNLMTIMEITANNSTLDDFKCPGWQIGLEYAGRIFHDLEYGRLKWENLADGLQPHTFLYAKDTVEQQNRSNFRGGAGLDGGRGGGRGKVRGGGRGGRSAPGSERSDDKEGEVRVCQSYNGFWTGNGCAYEFNNNRKCGYDHYCNICFEKSNVKEKHKAYFCPHAASSTGSLAGAKPAVTSG